MWNFIEQNFEISKFYFQTVNVLINLLFQNWRFKELEGEFIDFDTLTILFKLIINLNIVIKFFCRSFIDVVTICYVTEF